MTAPVHRREVAGGYVVTMSPDGAGEVVGPDGDVLPIGRRDWANVARALVECHVEQGRLPKV